MSRDTVGGRTDHCLGLIRPQEETLLRAVIQDLL